MQRVSRLRRLPRLASQAWGGAGSSLAEAAEGSIACLRGCDGGASFSGRAHPWQVRRVWARSIATGPPPATAGEG